MENPKRFPLVELAAIFNGPSGVLLIATRMFSDNTTVFFFNDYIFAVFNGAMKALTPRLVKRKGKAIEQSAPMKFETASAVESVCQQLKLADFPRSQNRALINALLNGNPPYTPEEVRDNNIEVNVNFLEGTKLAMDARSQGNTALMKPGRFFSASTDYGAKHKRTTYSETVSREVNRVMKRSPLYFETQRSRVAQNIAHGISPVGWDNRDSWCPDAIGVEDVYMPSNTLLTMKNLPFFAIYRSYTAHQLKTLTRGPKIDPGWNMPLVDKAIRWVDAESQALMGTQWPTIWSPEKMEERVKSDGGLYASDAVPTIDCYDFYFWNDEDRHAGWNRRLIIDAFGTPGVGGAVTTVPDKVGSQGQFLYDPGKRKYADKLSELISFQFADLSAVAPFRYHSVRSLGYLLYAVCHLQNRLRCKFNEAVFEGLMMYMRVKSLDEAERALKIELISRGIVDETVQFLSPAERWQVNQGLAQLGLQENQRIITENTSSYVQNTNFSNPNIEKTKFQVMAETNAQTSLITAALLQANRYQTFEYQEDFRRFCKKNSRDPDVREFRKNCLIKGVPEEVLVPEAWDISPEQVLGAGNKTLEMAISEQLMQFRQLYDPQAQRTILHDITLAITDNPALADELVPPEPTPSAATEDAQRSAAVLLAGLPMVFKSGVSHAEYAQALLGSMSAEIRKITALQHNMANQDQIVGLLAIAGRDLQGQPTSQNGIAQHLQKLEEDPEAKQSVRQMNDGLEQLLNEVKGFVQRLEEQMQAQTQGNGQHQPDPAAIAKAEEIRMQGELKRENTRQSHAEKSAQRQVSFESKQQQDAEKHKQELAKEAQRIQLEEIALDARTAGEIKRSQAQTQAEASSNPESQSHPA